MENVEHWIKSHWSLSQKYMNFNKFKERTKLSEIENLQLTFDAPA